MVGGLVSDHTGVLVARRISLRFDSPVPFWNGDVHLVPGAQTVVSVANHADGGSYSSVIEIEFAGKTYRSEEPASILIGVSGDLRSRPWKLESVEVAVDDD